MSKSSNVKVYCRIRPENEQEISSGLGLCLNPQSPTSLQIIVNNLSINSGLKENYSDKTTQEFTLKLSNLNANAVSEPNKSVKKIF